MNNAAYDIQYPTEARAHIPVMLEDVLRYLSPKDGETYVDGTFGGGGYTRAILNAANCKLFAIDCDPYVEPLAKKLTKDYARRFTFLPGKFSQMRELLLQENVEKVDGVVLDLGVSSMQLDTAERGFSFSKDAPLDMRMSAEGRDAASLVNHVREDELAGILFKYGGEKQSRRIARGIVAARVASPITRTVQLAEIIRKSAGHYNDTIDPATRSFQAIRIWVNQEMEELEEVLLDAERILKPAGRLVIVSFHSEEDGIIKRFLNEHAGRKENQSRYYPVMPASQKAASFALLTKKAVPVSDHEVAINPRARSAKLRAAVRTTADAWGASPRRAQ